MKSNNTIIEEFLSAFEFEVEMISNQELLREMVRKNEYMETFEKTRTKYLEVIKNNTYKEPLLYLKKEFDDYENYPESILIEQSIDTHDFKSKYMQSWNRPTFLLNLFLKIESDKCDENRNLPILDKEYSEIIFKFCLWCLEKKEAYSYDLIMDMSSVVLMISGLNRYDLMDRIMESTMGKRVDSSISFQVSGILGALGTERAMKIAEKYLNHNDPEMREQLEGVIKYLEKKGT